MVATFALGTSSVISLSIANQYTFIDYRNLPGGPVAFAAQDSSIPDGLVVSWSSVIGDWLTGGLLVSDISTNLQRVLSNLYSYI